MIVFLSVLVQQFEFVDVQCDRDAGAVAAREKAGAAEPRTDSHACKRAGRLTESHCGKLALDAPLAAGFSLDGRMAQRAIERGNAARRVAQDAAFRELGIEHEPVRARVRTLVRI